MKERGILFSAPMVRAILDGSKTQTRRVIKPQPGTMIWEERTPDDRLNWFSNRTHDYGIRTLHFCPSGVPGDLLYVKETWAAIVPGGNFDEITGPPSKFPAIWKKPYVCRYRADPDPLAEAERDIRGYAWRPSIHMPKWAFRIKLRVTDVRVERVQDISEEDCIAEGCVDGGCMNCGESSHPDPCGCDTPSPAHVESFIHLWDSINAKRSPWSRNGWVWAITFERIEP